MVYLLHAGIVSGFMAIAAAVWIVYAVKTSRRYFAVMGVPFVYIAIIYNWFALQDISADVRAGFVRAGLILLAVIQSAVLLLILGDRGRHGH